MGNNPVTTASTLVEDAGAPLRNASAGNESHHLLGWRGVSHRHASHRLPAREETAGRLFGISGIIFPVLDQSELSGHCSFQCSCRAVTDASDYI